MTPLFLSEPLLGNKTSCSTIKMTKTARKEYEINKTTKVYPIVCFLSKNVTVSSTFMVGNSKSQVLPECCEQKTEEIEERATVYQNKCTNNIYFSCESSVKINFEFSESESYLEISNKAVQKEEAVKIYSRNRSSTSLISLETLYSASELNNLTLIEENIMKIPTYSCYKFQYFSYQTTFLSAQFIVIKHYQQVKFLKEKEKRIIALKNIKEFIVTVAMKTFYVFQYFSYQSAFLSTQFVVIKQGQQIKLLKDRQTRREERRSNRKAKAFINSLVSKIEFYGPDKTFKVNLLLIEGERCCKFGKEVGFTLKEERERYEREMFFVRARMKRYGSS